MRFIARWLRPSALIGQTTGLDYAGTLSGGKRVYSNLRVVKCSPERIEFEGGAFADANWLHSGTRPGTITIMRRENGKSYRMSINTL